VRAGSTLKASNRLLAIAILQLSGEQADLFDELQRTDDLRHHVGLAEQRHQHRVDRQLCIVQFCHASAHCYSRVPGPDRLASRIALTARNRMAKPVIRVSFSASGQARAPRPPAAASTSSASIDLPAAQHAACRHVRLAVCQQVCRQMGELRAVLIQHRVNDVLAVGPGGHFVYRLAGTDTCCGRPWPGGPGATGFRLYRTNTSPRAAAS
jgi:hypothetical protein